MFEGKFIKMFTDFNFKLLRPDIGFLYPESLTPLFFSFFTKQSDFFWSKSLTRIDSTQIHSICSRVIFGLYAIQIFIMPRRSVFRVGGANLHVIAPVGNITPFKEKSQRWQAVGKTLLDLTGSRFKPQTRQLRSERVTAPPTGRFCLYS